MDLALLYNLYQHVPNNPVRLELSTLQKKELFSFMKRVPRIKRNTQKSISNKAKDGRRNILPYRAIAKNLCVGVNYRNVYMSGLKNIKTL